MNELVTADKLFFDQNKQMKPYELSKMTVCPKTLEYNTLTNSHASTVVHAVALWLEKIYQEDPKLKIADLNIQDVQNSVDFDQKKDN